MKKVLCLILSLIILFGVSTCAFAAGEADFKPALRFVLASDTHILSDSDKNEQRIRKMMALAYREAESDSEYKKVDALLVAGDLTNDGTKEEFDRFWEAVSSSLKPETKFYGVVAKNHDGYDMSRTELRKYYEKLTGNDADFNEIIGGYHFIGISVSEKKNKRYDSEQLAKLKLQLDKSVAEDPEKPIFVMHHEHTKGTVYGSSFYDGWGINEFKKLLKNYPQVVELSGHSHYPLNDPRSIWQGEYTAIGTGAIHYSEFTIGAARAYHPEDSEDTGTCWIAELDRDNNLRLRGYDVVAGKKLCEEMLLNPAKSENREFTPEKRAAFSKAPYFEENASLKIKTEFSKCAISVPEAVSGDGLPIVLYRAEAVNKNGKTIEKSWELPVYYRAVEDKSVEMELEGLPAGEYTFSVTALNAYGKASEPLQATATLEGNNKIKSFFERIGNRIEEIKEYFTRLFW